MPILLTTPRLLPITIVALAGMLYLRAADAVRAAFPSASSGAALAFWVSRSRLVSERAGESQWVR